MQALDRFVLISASEIALLLQFVFELVQKEHFDKTEADRLLFLQKARLVADQMK
jgi:hypothetical protein